MKSIGKYLCVLFAVCISTIILSGCTNEETIVVNFQSGISEPVIFDPNSPAVVGRVIKFGKHETSDFGPSFEFDKLKN